MKGSIFKDSFVNLGSQDYLQLGGIPHAEKGLHLKQFFGEPILKIKIQYIPTHFFTLIEVQGPQQRPRNDWFLDF